MENLIITFVNLVRVYVLAGAIFAVIFSIFFIQRLDPGAKSWNIGFRLLIFPGLVAFWPLFAVRLLRGKGVPTESNAHRLGAKRAV